MTKVSFSYNPQPQPYLWLPPNWNSGWLTAKNQAATTPCWITCVGDSISEGSQASDYFNKGFLGLIRDALTTNGSGSVPLHQEYIPQAESSFLGWQWPQNANSTIMRSDLGYHRIIVNGATETTCDRRFTFPYSCTGFDIYYADCAAGTWGYQLNGGAAGAATTTITNTSSNVPVNASTSTLTASQVTIKRQAVNTACIAGDQLWIGYGSQIMSCAILGVASHVNTNGIGLARFTVTGAAAYEYVNGSPANGSNPANRPKLLQGTNPQNDSSGVSGTTPIPSSYTGFGFPTQPHLFIFSLGVNESSTFSSGATYSNSITNWSGVLYQMIAAVRRARPNCSILLVSPAWGDGGISHEVTGGSYSRPFQEQVLLLTAQQFGCGYINFDRKWGLQAVTGGYMTSVTNSHPSDAGHADIASAILSII